jgi:hypothetical protein
MGPRKLAKRSEDTGNVLLIRSFAWPSSPDGTLAFDHCGVNAAAMIQAPKAKEVSCCQMSVKTNKNKTKTIFTAGLDKLGFIEAPFVADHIQNRSLYCVSVGLI